MLNDEILNSLFKNQDIEYRDFQSKLIPSVPKENIIGVRTPELRALAREFAGREGVEGFLSDLPHYYFDENQLHLFIISLTKNFEAAVMQVEAFLPFVDNWATCDQLSPKVFKKNREKLLPYIKRWLSGKETYTVRFGVSMLMTHFLDDAFSPEYPRLVSKIRSDEYYINMMVAWYFATALAKQYDCAIGYIERKTLAPWTHNKAIQKSVESRRITAERKSYLKTLKIKII